MNQTEQIATSKPGIESQDQSKKAFAPASALVSKIAIDFKKLQAFKGN